MSSQHPQTAKEAHPQTAKETHLQTAKETHLQTAKDMPQNLPKSSKEMSQDPPWKAQLDLAAKSRDTSQDLPKKGITKQFRRYLSENAYKASAGIEVLTQACALTDTAPYTEEA